MCINEVFLFVSESTTFRSCQGIKCCMCIFWYLFSRYFKIKSVCLDVLYATQSIYMYDIMTTEIGSISGKMQFANCN